jgi:HNH endonuclease/restriction-modification system family protein
MATPRVKLVERLVAEAGPKAIELEDLGDGWPSRVRVRVTTGWQPVDLYISGVGSHNRKQYEYRFQNPPEKSKRPIITSPGALPVLLGYSEEWGRPVCVAADVQRRLGSDHRFSVLFVVALLKAAAQRGWSEYHTTSDEVIVGFQPSLLPAFVEMMSGGIAVRERQIVDAITNAGLSQDDGEQTRERARAAASRVVVDARFRRDVMKAYAGECALCGLDWDMIEAAHIYPVTAPKSVDRVWNGLALCGNHHSLFDRHKIYVEPGSLAVQLHPDLLNPPNEACQVFVERTLEQLVVPAKDALQPKDQMFTQRYEWFGGAYAWVA